MKSTSKALELIYQDTEIHFLLSNDKNVMINATDMAKAFNKKIKDFMRLESTKNYIESFLKAKNSNGENPPYLKNQMYTSKPRLGTFMIRPLALKFASWLDPDFEVWVFEIIDQILFGNYKTHQEKTILLQTKK